MLGLFKVPVPVLLVPVLFFLAGGLEIQNEFPCTGTRMTVMILPRAPASWARRPGAPAAPASQSFQICSTFIPPEESHDLHHSGAHCAELTKTPDSPAPMPNADKSLQTPWSQFDSQISDNFRAQPRQRPTQTRNCTVRLAVSGKDTIRGESAQVNSPSLLISTQGRASAAYDRH